MKYDLIVIGGGPGGYVAAIRAAQLGLKTACVEKGRTLGGTCLNVGCIPSKSLLHASEMYAWVEGKGSKFGITAKPQLDLSQMMQHKSTVVEGLTKGLPLLMKKHGVTVIPGKARFVSPHEIQVDKETLEASTFILATGSEPIALPFLPFDEKQIVSSTGALSLSKVPKRLAVIGGGVIGVELASVYQRLGSAVTVIEMLDQICMAMDETVSKTLHQLLKKQGITFHLGAKVTKADQKKGRVELLLDHKGKSSSVEAETVLVAIGRKPFHAELGLESIGIQMHKNWVTVNGQFRTSIPHIFAIGDIIEGPMLAHRASEEGYAVAELIAGRKTSAVNEMAIPNVIYTHPEAAAVGITEQEATATGLKLALGVAPFKGNARARATDDTDGFVKVIGAGPNLNLVGMHIIGPQASEMIHVGVLAIQKRVTLEELAHLPFGHPTLSEAIKEACGNALGCAVHT